MAWWAWLLVGIGIGVFWSVLGFAVWLSRIRIMG